MATPTSEPGPWRLASRCVFSPMFAAWLWDGLCRWILRDPHECPWWHHSSRRASFHLDPVRSVADTRHTRQTCEQRATSMVQVRMSRSGAAASPRWFCQDQNRGDWRCSGALVSCWHNETRARTIRRTFSRCVDNMENCRLESECSAACCVWIQRRSVTRPKPVSNVTRETFECIGCSCTCPPQLLSQPSNPFFIFLLLFSLECTGRKKTRWNSCGT